MKKRFVLLMLVLCMLMSLMPLTAFTTSAQDSGCLTFSSSAIFSLKTNNDKQNWNGTLQYSRDLSSWSTWDGTAAIESSESGKLYLRGSGNNVITGSEQGRWVLSGTAGIACTGNIENLLDYETVADGSHPVMAENCYANMFNGCTSLTTAPDLPAETLTDYCYSDMFNGCTSLTTAPELPATTLMYACYANMFEKCTSLTAAPALPAGTLAGYCYYEMFQDCTSLTTAPVLPAGTLESYCYDNMFKDCTSLTAAPELPAETLAGRCYSGMFQGCTSLTAAPALPAETLADCCYTDMFNGCTSLTAAPALPATTLMYNCYAGMFNNCTSLTTVPALPATSLEYRCYDEMFKNCRALKISETRKDDYTFEWRIPTAGTATSAEYWNVYMLDGTGGSFQSNPAINTVYYVQNKPVEQRPTYITFSSAARFSLKTNNDKQNWNGTLQYSRDLSSWSTWDGTAAIESSESGKLYLRGSGNNRITDSEQGRWVLSGTAGIACTGNIENLLDYATVADGNHPAMTERCYIYMFKGCTKLTTAPELPAGTLADYCYYSMFEGCTSLSAAPALPAEMLAYHCYDSMFNGCTSLTVAPALPAETLADYCYYSMFQGCTFLTAAPALPAETLADNCYYSMFCDCTKLTAAPALPATTLEINCYGNMFRNCTSLTTAPALPAETLASYCYYEMFYHCTSLTAAPALPAETLASQCYSGMFEGCTSLSAAPALPAETLTDSCYCKMFYGCTSLTTAPALPAETLTDSCYFEMFSSCTSLTTVPALPATTLTDYCYMSMFAGCSALKISETRKDDYTFAWRIPTAGTATAAGDWNHNMLIGTGSSFKGNPEINTVYYVQNKPVERKRVTLGAADFTCQTPADLIYDGAAKTAIVTPNSGVACETPDVKYYKGETLVTSPTDVGTYTVKIDVAENYDYYAVTDLEVGSFTIAYGTATTDMYSMPSANTNGWHKSDITVSAKTGYEISKTPGNYGGSVALNGETGSGSQDIYLKATDGKVYKTTVTYKLDKTAPDGNISFNTNPVKKFLNSITFGLFFKSNVNVTITSSDGLSGIAKTEYYKAASVLSEADVKAISGWTDYRAFNITAQDSEKFIIYVRLTDTAGNITYFGSDGATFDLILPDIDAIDGKVYCAAAEVTVTDDNLSTVTLGGKTVTLDASGKFTVSPKAGEQTIVATDKAGNSTTVKITVNNGHTPNADDGDCTTAVTCSVCNEILTAAKAHSYGGNYIADGASGHYQNCRNAGCTKRGGTVAHTGEDDGNCATAFKCNACDYVIKDARTHDFSGAFTHDNNDHWHICTHGGCDMTDTKTAHAYSIKGTETPATYFDDGSRVDACVCGATATVVLPKLLDSALPTASIQIGTNRWNSLMSGITFGLFFKETQTVTITPDDVGSGVAKTEYYLANTETADFSGVSWTEYTSPFGIEPNNRYVVYVRVTDKAGNQAVVNSGGIVLENIVPQTDAIDGKIYCAAVEVTVTDDNLDAVTLDGVNIPVTNGISVTFTVSPKAGEQTVVATDKAGNSTTIKITVNDGHTPNADDGDCTTAVTCSVCNEITTAAKAHSYGGNYIVDGASGHYQNCQNSGCTKRGGTVAHTGEDDGNCATAFKCNACDYVIKDARTHDFSGAFTCDGNSHWHICARDGCDMTDTKTAHDYDTTVTELPATYFEGGSRIDACVCGATDMVVLPKLLDSALPTASIQIGTNRWNSLLNGITFGLFFKETQTVAVTSSDVGSGVAKTEYYLTNAETADFSGAAWTKYTSPFGIDPNNRYVVYVRVTDKAGNQAVFNSGGIVLENIVPQISVTDGKIYCAAAEVTVKDDNLDTVTLDGVNIPVTNGISATFTVSPKAGEQTIVATDKAGNSTTVKITVNDGHTWDKGRITAEPTAAENGEKTFTCDRCGETKTEPIAKLAPKMTQGANRKYARGDKDGLTFTADAARADLLSVSVDGSVIGTDKFTTADGSTIVTLKAAYLAMLPVGQHTLELEFVSGTVSAEFAVEASADTDSPKTGDNIRIILWIVLPFVSGGAALTIVILVRRKRLGKNSK